MNDEFPIEESHISKEEIADTRNRLKALGEEGYLQMMATINHPVAVARSRFYRQTRAWRLATFIVGFGSVLIVIVAIALFIKRFWLLGISLLIVDYIVVNRIIQTAINYELGARMLLLDSMLWDEIHGANHGLRHDG